MRRWLLLLALALPLLTGAETVLRESGVEVRGRPFFEYQAQHGYAEYRFTVKNSSPTRTRKVRVDMTTHNGAGMTKTVTAPPNERLEFSMFSAGTTGYYRMSITVDGRTSNMGGMNIGSSGYYRGSIRKSLLASKSINQDTLQQKIEKLNGWTGPNDFDQNYTISRTDIPPEEWSASWRAYSSFDGILLRQGDIDSMPPDVLAALRQYTECGGVLTILGGTDCPFSGRTVAWVSESQQISSYAVGFGRCFVHQRSELDIATDDRAWKSTAGAFHILATSARDMNQKFRVVEQMTVPVRGFLLLVTVFALVAGPLTLVVLAKTNRRIWLLWVVPLEAAIACALVLGYSFVSEGITPTVRMADITLLDQERHVATTLGQLGYYCPQRPAKGLFFADDWELQNMRNRYGPQQSQSIDWTRGQHLVRGWLKARVPTFFMCRRSAVRRERLECTVNNEGLVEVVNGLGADIKTLWFCDINGECHYAENIRAGQKAVLQNKSQWRCLQDLNRVRELFLNGHEHSITALQTNPTDSLTPGSYIACLDGAPFMEHGLGDRKTVQKADSIVYGILPKEVQP